jgi:hypothetical protein
MGQMVLPSHPADLDFSIPDLLLADELGSVGVEGPLPFLLAAELLGEFVVVAFVAEPGEGDEIEVAAEFTGGLGVFAAIDGVF